MMATQDAFRPALAWTGSTVVIVAEVGYSRLTRSASIIHHFLRGCCPTIQVIALLFILFVVGTIHTEHAAPIFTPDTIRGSFGRIIRGRGIRATCRNVEVRR